MKGSIKVWFDVSFATTLNDLLDPIYDPADLDGVDDLPRKARSLSDELADGVEPCADCGFGFGPYSHDCGKGG